MKINFLKVKNKEKLIIPLFYFSCIFPAFLKPNHWSINDFKQVILDSTFYKEPQNYEQRNGTYNPLQNSADPLF